MKIKKILFFLGLILLGTNVIGLFKTLRNPALYDEEKIIKNRLGDVTIKYPDIKPMLKKKPDETNEQFAIRINKVVNDGFAHYWKEVGVSKYNERVPFWENYMLYAASYVDPKDYKMYEFSNYKKNLERGVGLCSTHSIVVKGVLKEYGIDAALWDIAGHVVVRANVDKANNKWIILDPDFGVVVPHDTAAIQANPELVRPAYQNMAALYYPEAVDPYTTDHVVEIYGRDGNHIYDVDNWFEYFSYWAIWVLPILLMLPYLLQLSRTNKK
jgi:hypothetical protein